MIVDIGFKKIPIDAKIATLAYTGLAMKKIFSKSVFVAN
jgi:hypothetical protein